MIDENRKKEILVALQDFNDLFGTEDKELKESLDNLKLEVLSR